MSISAAVAAAVAAAAAAAAAEAATKTNTTTTTTTTTTTMSTVQKQQHQKLPLGWTTVQRKQPENLKNKRQQVLVQDCALSTGETKSNNNNVDDDNDNDDDQFLLSSLSTAVAAYCKCCPDGTSSMSSFINSLFNDQSLSYSKNMNNNNPKIIHTKAIFCLHDIDPQWFQGYILFHKKNDVTNSNTATIQTNNNEIDTNNTICDNSINNRNNSWGILCIQEEIDECLQCYDGGGYHQLTMSINTYYSKNNNSSNQTRTDNVLEIDNGHVGTKRPNNIKTKQPKQIQKVSSVQWTGADMIKLSYHNNNIISQNVSTAVTNTGTNNDTNNDNEWIIQTLNFDTDQLITDTAAIPYVKKYFSSLVQKIILLQQHNEEEKEETKEEVQQKSNNLNFQSNDITNLLPNVAIVIGTISIVFH